MSSLDELIGIVCPESGEECKSDTARKYILEYVRDVLLSVDVPDEQVEEWDSFVQVDLADVVRRHNLLNSRWRLALRTKAEELMKNE